MTPSSRRERERALRAQYDAPGHARHYAERRWTESRHARRTDRWERQTLTEMLIPLSPFARVLDLPCGHGRFAEFLRLHTRRLIQGDLSAEMLAARREPAAWTAQASLLALPFRRDSVDLAFCFRVLHHFPEPELRARALAELGRVSRRFVLTSYYDAHSLPVLRDRLRGKAHRLTPCSHAEFERDAAAAGLRVLRRRYRARWLSQQVIVLLERA